MTLLTTGSIVLAVVALTSSFLVSHKIRAGWLVSMAFNGLALPYDAITKQYGFIVVSIVAFIIGLSAFRRWGRDADSTP